MSAKLSSTRSRQVQPLCARKQDCELRSQSAHGQSFHQRRSAALLATVLVILLAPSGQALARSATPNLAECSAIALDQARLACYDRVSGFAGNPSTIAPTSTAMEAPAAPASAPVSAPVAIQQDSKSRSDAQVVVGTESASMIDEAWGFNADSSR